MRFDNDLHIHSKLSACSDDPEQTTERILEYANTNGLKTICVTDHFWDDAIDGASDWYKPQHYEHISASKPLPQADGIRFLFGCETELDKQLRLGISPEKYDLFDFIVIPTTHFHMSFTTTKEEKADATTRAATWVKRLDAVLHMDLPFRKVGIAHLTSGLIAPTHEEFLETLRLLPQNEMQRLFTKVAELGAGIELNYSSMNFLDEEADVVLRVYRTAKKCGCKFYFGSDAHHPTTFDKVKPVFERATNLLCLTEKDKFTI